LLTSYVRPFVLQWLLSVSL
jgi:hypothetical protein